MRILFLASVILSLAACGPTLRIKPGEIPAASVPPSELKNQAEGYVAAHINEQNYKEIKSGPETKRVSAVVERLARAAGYPAHTFPVHLVDAGEEVNAAAFNGASIVVYRELLNRIQADTDLATVLGHEIGHILAKHYTDDEEEKTRSSAVSIGSSILGAVASIATSAAGYRGAADLAGDVTETATSTIGYGAFVGSFNRTQEYEADHIGLLIMAKAGYNPESAIEFWKNSDKVFGSSGTKVGAFFSTHPASSDRIAELEKALPLALPFYKLGAVRNELTNSKPSSKK